MTRLATALLLIIFAQTAYGQGAGELRWKFQPGKKIAVKMDQKMEQSMTVLGKAMKNTSNTTTWMTWKFTGVDAAGNTSLVQTIDRVQVTMDLPTGKVVADTDSKEKPTGRAAQLLASFRPMIGAEMKQKMAPNGKISDVVLPQGIIDALKESPGSEEIIKSLSEKASPVLPVKTVRIGDKWKTNAETESPAGIMVLDSRYTYKGEKDINGRKLHEIDIDLNMSFKEGTAPEGAKIDVVKQDTTGKLYFDGNSGQIAASTVRQDLTMEVSAAGTKFNQNIKQATTAIFKTIR